MLVKALVGNDRGFFFACHIPATDPDLLGAGA
jgi:hypothetical protein